MFTLTNTGIVSRATLEKLLRDGAECVWAFPGAILGGNFLSVNVYGPSKELQCHHGWELLVGKGVVKVFFNA